MGRMISTCLPVYILARLEDDADGFSGRGYKRLHALVAETSSKDYAERSTFESLRLPALSKLWSVCIFLAVLQIHR